MKHNRITRLLAVLLAGLLLFPLAACGENQEDETTPQGDEALSEEDTAYKPDIAKTNYASDFNVIMIGWDQSLYIPDPEAEREHNGISDTVYERYMKIKDQLGVDMKVVDGGTWTEYDSTVQRSVQTGDDNYQMVMTHVYQGIVGLVTKNCLSDMSDLPSVNLDAPYWNKSLMDQIMVDDRYLLGYNDFCLSHTHCIVFNKDMMSKYSLDAPYDLVRNKQWTLDKLLEMASTVTGTDTNGDGVLNWNDTYGITGWGWIYLISLVTSSGLKIVDRDENDHYYIAYGDNEEKVLSLIDKVRGMYNADYSFLWKSTFNAGETIDISSGRNLFQFYSTTDLKHLKGEDVRFGVLPYPLWDSNQDDYKSLNWNGVMGVPSVLKNPEMVSDVMELLPYYTAPVKIAYYEDLLGAKVADAPDDVDMLNIIWSSQVTDVGLVFCNAAVQMDALVYMVPKLCENQKQQYSSFIKTNSRNAQKGLDTVFEGKS